MNQRQRELQDKLDRRVPRGSRGSVQNQFRNAVCFYANHPQYTFEESLDLGILLVRKDHPGFVPTVLPGP